MTARERAEALLRDGVPMGRLGMDEFAERLASAILRAEAAAYERAAKAAGSAQPCSKCGLPLSGGCVKWCWPCVEKAMEANDGQA